MAKFLVLGCCTFLLCCMACSESREAKNYLHESKEDFDARMKWWRDARFGMFIHWGLYSVPAGVYQGETGHAEWIQNTAEIPVAEYEKYAEQFNPTKFDADAWMKLAKEAGMKYVVITSKHHEGFSLWDSKVTEYDVMDATPFKRDILRELADACKKYDLTFCFYHSIMDWNHPDAQAPFYPRYNGSGKKNPNFPRYVESFLKPQLRELVENYGPLGVLWFDGEWIDEWTEEMGKDLYNFTRDLQPDIIINNRVGKGRQGMQGMNAYEGAAGDFGTPEQEILEGVSDYDWESCMTINDHWGYASYDNNWKSTKTLIHNIVDIASKGGNYLLNVGPTAEGLIPPQSVERLQEIGAWMRVNGEAIYATDRMKHFKEGKSIHYTRAKEASYIYAIAVDWPGDKISLKYVEPEPGSEIHMLGVDEPLGWRFSQESGLTMSIPANLQAPENRPGEHAWTFRIKGKAAAVAETPDIISGDESGLRQKLFAEKVSVRLESDAPGATLRYTLDGSAPSANSPQYSEPIVFTKTTMLKAAAFKPGLVPSPVAQTEFILINQYKSISYASKYSEKYAGLGDLTLGDGVRGSTDFHDKKWLGWEGEDMVATIDLGSEKSVSRIRAGFLQNIDSWIWAPKEVAFAVSNDGIRFETLKLVNVQISEKDDAATVEDFATGGLKNVNARYIKITAAAMKTCPEWHRGAGGKAWVFCDEIIVE